MARVKAQLRRAQGRLAVSTLPWQIDDERLRIRWNGQVLGLTVLEFRLLRLMLAQPGRVFSRAQLLDCLHADDRAVRDRAIDSHVKNLRRKVQAVETGFDGVRSVYGVGYSFEMPAPDGAQPPTGGGWRTAAPRSHPLQATPDASHRAASDWYRGMACPLARLCAARCPAPAGAVSDTGIQPCPTGAAPRAGHHASTPDNRCNLLEELTT